MTTYPSHQEGGGVVKYGIEWTPALVLLGAVVVLPLVPAFALIALVVVALAAVAALVALAGAVLATPYLLVRTLRRRLAERHPSTEGSGPIAAAIAHATSALADPTPQELTVNTLTSPADTGRDEAVDQLIARVLSRAHRTRRLSTRRTRRARSFTSLIRSLTSWPSGPAIRPPAVHQGRHGGSVMTCELSAIEIHDHLRSSRRSAPSPRSRDSPWTPPTWPTSTGRSRRRRAPT